MHACQFVLIVLFTSMFNPTRAKVQLKLSVNRLQMLQNKKNMLAQQQRKEIARLLEIGKEESARIRVWSCRNLPSHTHAAN